MPRIRSPPKSSNVKSEIIVSGKGCERNGTNRHLSIYATVLYFQLQRYWAVPVLGVGNFDINSLSST
jgi:hypothetical protein